MRTNVDAVDGIEGENDFSGKRYVWLRDPKTAFVKGWIVEDLGGDRILVQCDDGSVSSNIPSTRVYALGISRKADTTNSNAKSTTRASIKSILPSSIRQTIWPN